MYPETTTVINPVGLLFTLSMGILMLVLPRRWALLPVAFITCYMTFGQKLVVFGLDFTMLRVMVLFASARLILRREFISFKWLAIDKVVLLWAIFTVLIFTLLWQTTGALINRLGVVYNALGLYFIFRFLIRDVEDVQRTCRMFAVLLFPVALSMLVEKFTGRNLFFGFGGVPEFTVVRDGVLRCQGPFLHPILAGTFGAVWLPLFVGLWWQGNRNRSYAAIGILSSTLITFLSGSSGPMGTYMAGLFALCLWPFRGYTRVFRWGLVAMLIALHLVMKDSVWFILARLKILSASSGWHRANVIDKAVTNLSDWWLLGTKDPESWGIWAGDITNQYIREGIGGGLITLALFITIIVLAFSSFGHAMQAVKAHSPRLRRFLWGAGAALFAHVVSFFGVSYFDQNVVNWFMLLAFAAVAAKLYGRRAELAPRMIPTPAKVLEPA